MNKKNKKGFTLIELLAVIVILAIIALIAVPIVLNIINSSKESATLRSTELYIDGVNKFVASEQLKKNSSYVLADDKSEITVSAKQLKNDGYKINGTEPNEDAEITIKKSGVTSVSRFYMDDRQISISNGKISIVDEDDVENLIYSLKSVKYDIRLKSDGFGIRWYTDIDKTLVDKLKKKGATIEYGTIIAPYDYLTDGTEFTKDMSKSFIDVKYNSLEYYKEDDFYGIVGSIANVSDKNADRKFTGRGYITVTYKEKTITRYADYIDNDIEKSSVSLAELCYNYKNNKKEEYNNLDSSVKTLVDKFAEKHV